MGDRTRLEVEGAGQGEILADRDNWDGSSGDYLNRLVAPLVAGLDAKLDEHLLSLPPGAPLCVHGVEVLMPADGRSGDRLTVRQDVHVIATPNEYCPSGAGSRTVYTAPGAAVDPAGPP